MKPFDDDNNESVIDERESMAITTALLENQTPIAPDAERLARMRMQLLNAVRSENKTASEIGSHDSLYTLRATEGEWIRLTPLAEVKLLRSDANSRSMLLRIAPGGRIPPHQHVDVEEECYVLEGEVHIDDLHLAAGDYHLAPRGVPHNWLWSDTGALLLLRADVNTQYLPR